jgi:hypothetical protein
MSKTPTTRLERVSMTSHRENAITQHTQSHISACDRVIKGLVLLNQLYSTV